MKNVRELLDQKGSAVFSVQPDITVFATLQLMADKEIGAVLVFEGDRLVGMFSERDYARQVILKGKASKDTLVREVMTSRVTYVRPEQTVDDCMALMTDKRVRHLPVLDQGRVVGLVSIGDIVKAVISEKQFIIEQLENYISSGG
jgi:CBS domain-containing protein